MLGSPAAFHDEIEDAHNNHHECNHCNPVEFHKFLLSCLATVSIRRVSQSVILDCHTLVLSAAHL